MKINGNFIKEKIMDECVVVPCGSDYKNGVFTLNGTGEIIFDLIAEGKEKEEIVDVLIKEYSADKQEITLFVDEFLTKLQKVGILIND